MINFHPPDRKLAPHEERLLDIADPSERAEEFSKLVNGHNWQKEILSSIDFDLYDSMCKKMTSISEPDGIGQFLRVKSEITKISLAVRECAMDLDGYIQDMSDVIRGK